MLNLLLILAAANLTHAAPLPVLSIGPNSTTVSGISSGAFMAMQLQVAFSSRIHGTGSVAGGIYGCADGNALKAQAQCMAFPGTIETESFVSEVKDYAKKGRIDDTANLKAARFYLFHSRADQTVRFPALGKLEAFVKTFTPASQVKTVAAESGAHAFPTEAYGAPCDTAGPPFLVNCKRDVAGEILSQLYPGLKPPAAKLSGQLMAFDQTLYSNTEANLSDEGFLYVPKACEKGPCRLHIALHGCKMSPDFIDDKFREHAGYNRWADANRIVVAYPSAAKSFLNPNGCWDWFGVTGGNYLTKQGPQMAFFAKLMSALGVR
ncbi:MAG: PHB depolymerase [Proteobacteria bacterium]|nr:MAG: PHB depolymerase [Pseudomonadota bacterium]